MDELIKRLTWGLSKIGFIKIPDALSEYSCSHDNYRLIKQLKARHTKIAIFFAILSILLLYLSTNAWNIVDKTWVYHLASAAVYTATALSILQYLSCLLASAYFSNLLYKMHIECSSCEHAIDAYSEWSCPRCKQEIVKGKIFKSVLDTCPHCDNSPTALQCPNCHKPIPFSNEEVRSRNWWARLLTDTYVDTSDDTSTAQVKTSEDKLQKHFEDRLGILKDLHKVKKEFIRKAEDIQDADEHRRYLEIVEHIADEIEDKEIW